jgi:predicted DNA-binding transcriptional regulator YafY
MKILDVSSTVERIDFLVRMKKTGTLKELSDKLEVSVSTVKRNLDLMRELGAPIIYSHYRQSYIYEYDVYYLHGFVSETTIKEYRKSKK